MKYSRFLKFRRLDYKYYERNVLLNKYEGHTEASKLHAIALGRFRARATIVKMAKSQNI